MSGVTIRSASEADVPVICDFVRKLAEYERLQHEVNFTESQYRQYLFTNKFEPAPEVILSDDNGRIIGFALFIQIMNSVIHLEDLFVLPEARGKGAGLALLSGLAKLANERKVSALEWSCLDWNKPSLDFYASLGAKPIHNRSLFRITGCALTLPHGHQHRVERIKESFHELDARLRGLELLDEQGYVIGSLFYTLSFTTFLATPVILVTSIVSASPFESAIELVSRLIEIANEKGFSRIDIRISPEDESELATRLVGEFQAFEMTGWIPHILTGEPLAALANRV